MEKINQKLTTLREALETLRKGIELYIKYQRITQKNPTEEQGELFLGLRDSMIQRFEYCTDLLWKLLKVYLEDIEKITPEINSPRSSIREAVKTRIITESQGNDCLVMIKNRNETSHIYHEEIAQEIAERIPEFYILISTIHDTIQKRIEEI